MDDLVYWPLLMRYVAGECTPAERAQVDEWIVREPGRRAYVDSLRRLGAATSAAASEASRDVDPAAALERVRAQLSHMGRPLAPSPSRTVATRSTVVSPNSWSRKAEEGIVARAWVGIAGVSLCVALGAGAALGSLWRNSSAARDGRTYVTLSGQRETVTLSDGTEFTLAPASRLRVPTDYAGGDRTVALDGEAYFAVVHDPAHPFAVRSRGTVVRDVGTRFDVRAYADDDRLRLVVAEGAVTVRADQGAQRPAKSVVVSGGSVAEIDAGGTTTVTTGVPAGDYLAWTTGEVVFQHTSVAQVARDLMRRYDIEVHVPDSAVAARRVTARFAGESLPELLAFLSLVIDVDVERHGRVVTLIARHP